jgi:hypothetical protein
MASSIPRNRFLGASDGMTRSYKLPHAKIYTFSLISDEVKLYIKIIEDGET